MNLSSGNFAGFVKLQRSAATEQLIGDPLAMHLLTVIALRARFTEQPSIDGLTFGQAQIGDWTACGMTEKQYRCAKDRLKRYGLASFTSTNRGTVATLSDSRVFSLRYERDTLKQGDPQGGQLSEVNSANRASSAAGEGRARGGQGATNQNGKNGKNAFGRRSPSVWELQQRAEAIRQRRRDLSEGHEGQTYVGMQPGKTSPYEWTDEGRNEFERLGTELSTITKQLANGQ